MRWAKRAGHVLSAHALCLLSITACVPTEGLHEEPASVARWRSCAEMLHPDHGYSGSELRSRFQRPQNIEQVLQNLKLAQDQDWPLQPHFYDEQTLLQFFDGTQVTWKRPPKNPLIKGVESVAMQIDSRIFPRIAVSVEANCWYSTVGPETVQVNGSLHITGRRIPELTLRVIRGVFGPETENRTESGAGNDADISLPQDQGSVFYANRRRDTGLVIGTRFIFALRGPEPPIGRTILDDDVVQAIGLGDHGQRILEN